MAGRLVQSTDLSVLGSFRVPAKPSTVLGVDWFNQGGGPIAFNPAKQSLFMVGYPPGLLNGVVIDVPTGEISIPDPVNSSVLADLPRATLLQAPVDILSGLRTTVDGNTVNGARIGGLLPWGDKLIVSVYLYYEGGNQTKSHFVTGQDFSALGPVTGPFIVPTSFRNPGAAFVNGYMATVPAAWRDPLGVTALTGQGNLSITTRTSFGPSLSGFNPDTLPDETPSQPLFGYPMAHQTLGGWGPTGNTAWYNGKMEIAGVVFPDGTDTVLVFGRRGTRFCYGAGTNDPSLDLKPVPTSPGVIYCYDPSEPTNKGGHGYPYEQFVACYDANDFLAVKAGQKQPWEVVPYETGVLALPFAGGRRDLAGVAYDPATQRIFLSSKLQDGTLPLVHVVQLTLVPPTPPTPPAPTITLTDCGCAIENLSMTPPDQSGGWDATVLFNGEELTPPIPHGTYEVVVVWQKNGETRTSLPTTVTCDSTKGT